MTVVHKEDLSNPWTVKRGIFAVLMISVDNHENVSSFLWLAVGVGLAKSTLLCFIIMISLFVLRITSGTKVKLSTVKDL